MHQNQRLADLEKILNWLYEKLAEAEKHLILTNDILAKTSIQQRIRYQILPELRRYESEYWALLAQETGSYRLEEGEARNVIGEVVPKVELIENKANRNYPDELMQSLQKIRDKLNEPGIPATAKVKLALPLIPGILSYDVELDTESELRISFQPIMRLFKKALEYDKEVKAINPDVYCPYRGLLVFQEKDQNYFFGRESFVESLFQAAHKQPLVPVIGASGSGKSSVVFAGLIPRLRAEGCWLIESFRPRNQPFYNLASVLVRLLKPDLDQIQQPSRSAKLLADLVQGKLKLPQVLANILDRYPGKRLLLVVDQLEEIYTFGSNTQEQQQFFVDALLAAVQSASSRLTVIFTLRADFFGYALSYLPFAEALRNFSPMLLPAMNRQELEAVIERPAQTIGVQLEEGLTERILDDISQEPGNLPLLEFTLTQLWAKQSPRKLTHQAYAEIGGVAKALANHAEAVYANLNNSKQKQTQQIFLELVRPGEGTEDTRRLVTRAEVGDWELVDFLADNRLLIIGHDEALGVETVEIVHEVLIRKWERFHLWVEEERTFLTWRERLRMAMRQWQVTDRDEGALLRGFLLVEAKKWQQQRQEQLSPAEQDFIQRSLLLERRDTAVNKTQRRLSIFLGIISFLSAAVSTLILIGSELLKIPLMNQLLIALSVVVIVVVLTFFAILFWNRFFSQYDYKLQQIAQEIRQLENCTDIEAIGKAYHPITTRKLQSPVSTILRRFNHISEDVKAALNQRSTYHQRLALRSVSEKIDRLLRDLASSREHNAKHFLPVAEGWGQILSNHCDKLAKVSELYQEIDSPYIIGLPLTEQQEIFVGRSDTSQRIEQLILKRSCPPLLLYGQRRMGKTSLLKNFSRLLSSDIIPLFVDLQRAALSPSNAEGFIFNLAKYMVDSAKQQSGLTLPNLSREELIAEADPFSSFDNWLDIIQKKLEQKTALLILDEFEALDKVIEKGRFDEEDVLGMLRHLIQHRPRFKVLLAGSHTIEEFQRWASYLINVQVVHISYLKQPEARQLIEQPVQDFTLRYEPNAVDRVLQLTRCHPFLIQLLCAEIIALKNEQDPSIRRRATLADVEAAIPEALSVGSFFFADIQSNQADAAGLAILQFLAARGEGATVTRLTILQYFPDKSDAINLLLQRELIEEVSEGYRFQVELIRRWFASS